MVGAATIMAPERQPPDEAADDSKQEDSDAPTADARLRSLFGGNAHERTRREANLAAPASGCIFERVELLVCETGPHVARVRMWPRAVRIVSMDNLFGDCRVRVRVTVRRSRFGTSPGALDLFSFERWTPARGAESMVLL